MDNQEDDYELGKCLSQFDQVKKRSRKNTLSFDMGGKATRKGSVGLSRSTQGALATNFKVNKSSRYGREGEIKTRFPRVRFSKDLEKVLEQNQDDSSPTREIRINTKKSFMNKLRRATIKIKKGEIQKRFYKNRPDHNSILSHRYIPSVSPAEDSSYSMLPSSLAQKPYLRNPSIPHKDKIFLLLSSVIKNDCIDKFREKLGLVSTPYGEFMQPQKKEKRIKKQGKALTKKIEFSNSIINSQRCLNSYKITRRKQRYYVKDYKDVEEYDWHI
ncbi:unnamed protein product [Moneuplotes crassus]|uniref:Uncharacterized protein n=1 Tax=Euplotes crassus TaxID=5936 RepID=A0AAD2CZ00_EUPCR|nr:unnamed protein product [Moneuplotes crassus]